MKKILIVLAVLVSSVGTQGQERDSVLTVFWNLENFFDYIDQGTGESDTEFSSMGSRHWTKKRFYRKCDNIAKAMFWMGDRYGRMPDVLGFAEIENKSVLQRLLTATLLRKYDYEIVHRDSPDRRGIDVALLYRRTSFNLVSASWTTPEHEGEPLATREILQVCLEDTDGRRTHFIVNHHPSKYGGSDESDGRRMAAMTALKRLCDSLSTVPDCHVVAMGDFNDSPEGPAFDLIEGTLVNKGISLHAQGEGTIRFEGKWDLIDNYLVSPLIQEHTEMYICKVPFLMTWERKHPGEKPLRTYSGPRHLGGVSDHCPVILWYFKDNSYL